MQDEVNLMDWALSVLAVLLLPLLPALLCLKLCQRALTTRPRLSPCISPTSYTPLPVELLSPPLPDGVHYTHHCITNDDSRIHYIRTAGRSDGSSDGAAGDDNGRIPLLFVHGFPDFVSRTAQSRSPLVLLSCLAAVLSRCRLVCPAAVSAVSGTCGGVSWLTSRRLVAVWPSTCAASATARWAA